MQKIVYFSNKIISPTASPLPVRLGHGTESRKNTNCEAPATWKSRKLAEGRQFFAVFCTITTSNFLTRLVTLKLNLIRRRWNCLSLFGLVGAWPLTIKLRGTSSIIDKLRTQISRGRQDGCAQKILSYST